MAKNKVKIEVYGNGAETCHASISKEAYEWWKKQDTDMLETYGASWSDDDYDFEVPEFAKFLKGGAIYDMDTVLDHYWRIAMEGENARLTIEVNDKNIFENPDDKDDEWYSPMTEDVIIGDEEDEDETDIRCGTTWTDSEKEIFERFQKEKYIVTYQSVEKGNFIDMEFEIDDEFDKTKLIFYTAEDWYDGIDKIADVKYDGKELENEGGDSTGKGIWVFLWKWGE